MYTLVCTCNTLARRLASELCSGHFYEDYASSVLRQDTTSIQPCRQSTPPPCPFRFIMPFERTNLHLSVELREGGPQRALRGLLERRRVALAAGRTPEPTLIYCLSRTQVDEVAGALAAPGLFGDKVGR
jgi:superfamily II DNA helicase RecQ